MCSCPRARHAFELLQCSCRCVALALPLFLSSALCPPLHLSLAAPRMASRTPRVRRLYSLRHVARRLACDGGRVTYLLSSWLHARTTSACGAEREISRTGTAHASRHTSRHARLMYDDLRSSRQCVKLKDGPAVSRLCTSGAWSGVRAQSGAEDGAYLFFVLAVCVRAIESSHPVIIDKMYIILIISSLGLG